MTIQGGNTRCSTDLLKKNGKIAGPLQQIL